MEEAANLSLSLSLSLLSVSTASTRRDWRSSGGWINDEGAADGPRPRVQRCT